ncbi:Hypothetical_protein [Hexamita inflata]|uniref:Hypothetical_protein n=1 Tax=Hexamita inflata TaxID=28002 RepID=A0AA86RG69_9EUKA|nr:Hypothetical protein HINF_LOCUS63537 [Hexamita inflata]
MSSASFVLEQLNTELYEVLLPPDNLFLLHPTLESGWKVETELIFKVNFKEPDLPKRVFFTFCLKNDANFVVQGESEFKMGEHEGKIVKFDCAANQASTKGSFQNREWW